MMWSHITIGKWGSGKEFPKVSFVVVCGLVTVAGRGKHIPTPSSLLPVAQCKSTFTEYEIIVLRYEYS